MAISELVRGSDGLGCLKMGSWAKEKLSYIERYCGIFATGMKGWRQRVYIDLFAGPGRAVIEASGEEIEGSPLIAMHADFTHYFFNDGNAEAIGYLRSRLGDRPDVFYSTIHCNEAVDFIRSRLPATALSFCFIDPFKWEIHFNSIERLTARRRMDLAITFHSGSMKRVAAQAPDRLDPFFPDSSWRDSYRAARHKSRALLDNYEQGLSKLGYREFRDYVLVRNSRCVPLYHLLFASKDKKGGEFWDKISQKSPYGQLRMFREETDIRYTP